jgi:hypothetical protein
MPNEPTAPGTQQPAATDTPIYDDLARTVPGFADLPHDVPDNAPAQELPKAS